MIMKKSLFSSFFLAFAIIISSSEEFLLGWYSDSDADYLKVLVGDKSNRYGYIDPYCEYYNLFLNYSVFNSYKLPDSIDFAKTTPFLSLSDSVVKNRLFVADLPRYSSLLRLLFAFPPGNSGIDSSVFSICVFDSSGSNVTESSLLRKSVFTGRRSNSPVYSSFSFFDSSDGTYACFDIKEKLVMTGRMNPYVYRHGSIFGFSFRKLASDGWFCINLIFSDKASHKSFSIISSRKVLSLLPQERLGEASLSLDGFIFPEKGNERRVDMSGLFETDALISNPAYLLLGDTIFRPFELNLDKILSLCGTTHDSLCDVVIYARNSEIADATLSFTNDFSLSVLKKAVDRIMDSGTNQLAGFYTGDEIERTEVFCHDRWMKKYSPANYPSVRLIKKKKNTLISLQDSIRNYIKTKGKIPFTLSTVHFYVDEDAAFSDYDTTFTLFTDSFIFYDDYSYTSSFVSNFLKAADLADSLSLKILYVGDAYSTKTKQAAEFDKIRWRFFVPTILGADGMLFYSYFSPKAKSLGEFKSDENKTAIGYFSKIFTESGYRESLSSSNRFTVELSGGERRLSSVSADYEGSIFLSYCFYNPKKAMSLESKNKRDAFRKDDSDIASVIALMKSGMYSVIDVTPAKEGLAGNISSHSLLPRAFRFKADFLADELNRIFSNNRPNDFEVRILKFVRIRGN